jgi:hypothetical protein
MDFIVSFSFSKNYLKYGYLVEIITISLSHLSSYFNFVKGFRQFKEFKSKNFT